MTWFHPDNGRRGDGHATIGVARGVAHLNLRKAVPATARAGRRAGPG